MKIVHSSKLYCTSLSCGAKTPQQGRGPHKIPVHGTFVATQRHQVNPLHVPKTYRAFQVLRGFPRDDQREKKQRETSFARTFPKIKQPVWHSAERVKKNAGENCYHRLPPPKEISLAFQRPLCTSSKKRQSKPPATERRGVEEATKANDASVNKRVVKWLNDSKRVFDCLLR